MMADFFLFFLNVYWLFIPLPGQTNGYYLHLSQIYISYINLICITDAYLMIISSDILMSEDININKLVGIFKQFRDFLVKPISFLVSINIILLLGTRLTKYCLKKKKKGGGD